MQMSNNFIRSTGRLTLLSGILAFISNVLISLAVNFNFECFTNPMLLFEGLKTPQIQFFRWSMLTDIWGYYLLFVPAVFYLYEKMESHWRNIYAASGIGYAFMGAIGAAILAATGTHFLRESLGGDTIAKNSFLLVFHIVNNSIWSLLEMGIYGIFMLGAASVLRIKSKLLYFLTLSLGIAGIIDTAGHAFDIPVFSEIGLNFYLFFQPIWAIWLGILLMREQTA